MKNPLHFLFLLAALCTLGSSCRKLVEDKKKELLLEIITVGLWHVETYQDGSTTITDQFQEYNFQFFENGTVTGITASEKIKGTWVGDLQNLSITSNFPSSDLPLKKLNGTWKIIDSALDYVAAERNTSNGKVILHLRKNR